MYSMRDHGVVGGGLCGSQHIPNQLAYCDIAEIVGLIAPRPLLIEIGTEDGLIPQMHQTMSSIRTDLDQIREQVNRL